MRNRFALRRQTRQSKSLYEGHVTTERCVDLMLRRGFIGHANCVKFVKAFNLPLLLLGGGGYTMRNVSRAWAYETGLAAGVELSKKIPMNEYYEYFGPNFELDVRSSNMNDLNTREYLDRVKRIVLENLRHIGGPPGIQMTEVPRIERDDEDDEMDEDLTDPDERRPQHALDARIQRDGELSDSDDEGEGGRRHRKDRRQRSGSPRNPENGYRNAPRIWNGYLDPEAQMDIDGAIREVTEETSESNLGPSPSLNTDGPPSAIRDDRSATSS